MITTTDLGFEHHSFEVDNYSYYLIQFRFSLNMSSWERLDSKRLQHLYAATDHKYYLLD
jgi:hypothetical protein